MTMLSSYRWVKDAISTKGLQPLTLYYLIRNGMIYGTDGRMTVGCPFPTDLTFCAVGAATEKLLERLPEPITITLKNDNEEVVFRSGRLHGAIKTIDPAEWTFPLLGEVDRHPIPERMLPGLHQLRPFISDNASRPWALCVLATDDTLYATNNIAVAAVTEIDLSGIERALIPNWAIDFILAREDGLKEWSFELHPETKQPNKMAFHWADGSWMSTKLVDDAFPSQVEAIIAKAPPADRPISDEWRRAYEYVASLTDSHIEFYADRIVGKDDTKDATMTAVAEIDTPKPTSHDCSAWGPRFLEPVMKTATHFNPELYPDPCPFRGPDVVGVVIGRRSS